jgi:peptidoglycan/xylan/chitin deacetylase (PgdA/CDA1 family)
LSTQTFRCLTLHAEHLEVDGVWNHTSRLLRSLENAGGRATLFVHPFWAIRAGKDLEPRIRELLDRGHEIGQHTHFYEPDGASEKPAGLFTDENVRRCLERDLEYLRAIGADPRGFVAGGWAIHPEAMRWLDERDFAYDCTVRSFALKYENAWAAPGEGWTAPKRDGGLLRFPTTGTIAGAVLGRARTVDAGSVRYVLAYVHDYDLQRLAHRTVARALVARWRGGPWATAAELASRWTGVEA